MESVLIIDDEPVTPIGYETIVSEAGYEVAGSVPTAAAALRAASERTPDVALVDIHLGANADGLWVARELASLFGTRIVFVTGTSDERLVGAASLIGAAAVLLKPVPPRAIIDALDSAAHTER
jgi:DNA-binding NarL/FixJ family response regulator